MKWVLANAKEESTYLWRRFDEAYVRIKNHKKA